MKRLGGWGTRLDTAGSGYDIGRDALCIALEERESLEKPGLLTNFIEEKLNTSVWESIHDIYAKGDSYIASFTPIVLKAYALGDKKAEEILVKNAKRVAELIIKADNIYDCGNVVVASGSLMTKNEVFSKLITKFLPSHKKLIIPELPQIYGAGKTCLKLCDVDYKEFSDKFIEQYEKFINEE